MESANGERQLFSLVKCVTSAGTHKGGQKGHQKAKAQINRAQKVQGKQQTGDHQYFTCEVLMTEEPQIIVAAGKLVGAFVGYPGTASTYRITYTAAQSCGITLTSPDETCHL